MGLPKKLIHKRMNTGPGKSGAFFCPLLKYSQELPAAAVIRK